MRNPALILGVAVVLLLVGTPQALWSAPLTGTNLFAANLAASNGLEVLKTLVNPSTYQQLGFASVPERVVAQRGEAIDVFQMPLNLMASYVVGQDPLTLLQRDPRTATPDQIIVPVKVGGKARSSLTIEQRGSQWVSTKPGRSKLVASLLSTIASIPAANIFHGTKPFVVEVEVYDLWLIGYLDRKQHLVLVATTEILVEPLPADVDQIVIIKHQELSSDALYRIAFTSKRYNGKPN